jgi:very-short-patch-repair endonuclease
MAATKAQIEGIRRQLLDLTMRNRLLNYRPSKVRTIPIVDENPREIFDILVLQEKSMKFHPQCNASPSPVDQIDQDPAHGMAGGEQEDSQDSQQIRPCVTPDGSVPEHHTDFYLDVPLPEDVLQSRLFTISNQARTVLEEQGYSVLYLAIAFLEYMDSGSSVTSAKAPLILIPVELERNKVGEQYKLRWTGEEIIHNLSLAEKLKELSVDLPVFEMPEAKAGIDAYLTDVVAAIAKKKDWKVLSEIYLDFFSYTKFVMFKDLDPLSWPEGHGLMDHPLIAAVLNPNTDYSSFLGFAEEDVDRKLASSAVYHIVDADSSQIAAIEDVKSGVNLVVEGPPGTGKSQTITNIIAECLAQGKTVLFVSEKMAALEVVKGRLDRAGLGDFCLELHSRKSNKKQVLEELRRTVETDVSKTISFDENLNSLEGLKRELNDYIKALTDPIGERTLSPFDLICLHERVYRHFSLAERKMLHIDMGTPNLYDIQKWNEAVTVLGKIKEILPHVRPISKNPWRRCDPGILLPADIEESIRTVDRIHRVVTDLQTSTDQLSQRIGSAAPQSLKDLPQFFETAQFITISNTIDYSILTNPLWNAPNDQVEGIIATIEAYLKQASCIRSTFTDDIYTKDIPALATEFKSQSGQFLKILRSGYRSSRRDALQLYRNPPHKDDAGILTDLDQVSRFLHLKRDIRDSDAIGRSLFGLLWQGEKTSPEQIRTFAQWMFTFRSKLREGIFSEKTVQVVAAGAPRADIEQTVLRIEHDRDLIRTDIAGLADCIGSREDLIFDRPYEELQYPLFASHLNTLRVQAPMLVRWSQYVAFRKDCAKTLAAVLIPAIEADQIEPDDLLFVFEGNYVEGMLRIAYQERPFLAHFVGDLQEKKIQQFIQLDKNSLKWNQHRLTAKLIQDRPRIIGGASKESEMGVLVGEFNKKKGHKPIRRLLREAGNLIQKIKPCFMMSPLSIAQFLDPRSICFDVIIFDEASQVRPEDAMGALLRGKQLVVMGDSRQLPPTSFFDRIAAAEEVDEEESDSPTDMESILNLCKRSFPAKMLRWHYRSRHETLIAVSNREFYDSRLLIYPSPMDKAEDLGLKFIHLPDTVYDRGRSSVNRGEAKAVAQAVIDHYQKYPDKSLMVGTFNIRQQQAIQEEVEVFLRENPEIEVKMKSKEGEHFSVKNLETIQGDERDVIFISVGFGFDENKRLSLNFGPLNQDGGERRLNVLITRAREKCVLFSNFLARDLDIDTSAPTALKVLKLYMQYAETGDFHLLDGYKEDTDSPFEDSVNEFLTSNGYTVRKQVGCVGFRIDLAVVDKEYPGRYLLGIECDGAQYHSSKVARDRDRLRQQVLEGLGWKIYRVWSPDWYRNRIECEKKILEAVKRAEIEGKSTAPIKDSKKEVGDSLEIKKVKHTLSAMADEDPFEKIPQYQVCRSCGLQVVDDFSSVGDMRIIQAISTIVDVEGPVHVDDVVQRIRISCGIKRTGKKIQAKILGCVNSAVYAGKIVAKGSFLWPPAPPRNIVRRRDSLDTVKIEYICDEEICAAIERILQHQYATMPSDLVLGTARLLGIRSVRDGVTGRIESQIATMLDRNVLRQESNGAITVVNGT